MRTARIVVDGVGYYHCVSRAVNRMHVFKPVECEHFRGIMRGCERFAGVKVITYALLYNHFHILIEVPEPVILGESEMLERLGGIYSEVEVRQIKNRWFDWHNHGFDYLVKANMDKYQRRMYNLSEFMKTLKQRFTQWYNNKYERRGNLWEDRFKSLVVEPHDGSDMPLALSIVASYIDLNPVRAGLVRRPEEYRWSGYGEAAAGCRLAQKRLKLICSNHDVRWSDFVTNYRELLYVRGVAVKGDDGTTLRHGIDEKQVRELLAKGGELSISQILRLKVRYLSDGMVLGSKEFVESIYSRYRSHFAARRVLGACQMGYADWRGLHIANILRKKPPIVTC